jgi:DNA polymerase-1
LSSLAVSVIVAGLIAGSGFIGLLLQKHLAEQYTTERSRDMIGGGAGLLTLLLAAEERAGGAALVASGDRDSFQLASSCTTILCPSPGGEIARIGPEEVRQRYGVDPNQAPDFIALRGDPYDKLPGAAGVGPKRAAQLVRRYGTLDGVLDAGLFQTQAQILRVYRLIATKEASAPLPSLADQEPTWASASSLARGWGLKQLADPLAEKT